MLLHLLLLITGCKMAVDGEITDVTGAPIQDASVTLISADRSECQAITDATGVFELPCAMGTYDIYIGAAGYLDVVIKDFDASERKRYNIDKQKLIKLPSEEGLLMFAEDSYASMPPALIQRSAGGAGLAQWKHYCMPDSVPEEQTTRLSAGRHAFFDNESKGWRPWVLDEEGCAYKMAPKNKTKWETTYAQKAEFVEEQVAKGKTLVVMALPAGRYFIADWDGGFFTRGKIGEEKGFIGHYLVVE